MKIPNTLPFNAALRYADLGYQVFPCLPGKKAPLTEHGCKDAIDDPTQIRAWWGKYPDANIGISTARLLVLDIDGSENPWLDDADKAMDLARAPMSLTPGGGRHYIFRQPSGKTYRNTAGLIAHKVDTRADGGYIVVPPSVVAGKAYRWAETMELGVGPEELPEPPDWLLALLDALPSKTAAAPAVDETIKEGVRNSRLTSLAGTMRRRGLNKSEILTALLEVNKRCVPPLEDEEVERIAGSIAKYPPEPLVDEASILAAAQGVTPDSPPEDIEPIIAAATKNLRPIARQRLYEAIKAATGLPLSAIRQEAASVFKAAEAEEPDHLDLARKTIEVIGADNVISTEAHIWVWEGKGVWRDVDDRRIKIEVHNVLESSGLDVSQNRVNGVLDVFRTETFKDAHVWNVHEDTINVLNGELMLTPEGWRLCPHERENYRTTQLPVAYDPGADSPRFRQFLEEIFRGDADGPEKARALLEMVAYTLVSHARYERFILLVGNGANGKSVLLAVIRLLVGPANCAAVQPSQFGNQFQRAHLNHKLANIVSELKEGAELEDDALKAIVSGEPTTVSHKFKDPFVMMPFATCWFGTNHLPHTNDFSDAMFRRALVVPFNRQFKPGVDADPHLKDKLAAELPGILNMALAAYADAMKRGTFTEPASCIEAKHAWRLEADQAAQFAEDAIEWVAGERETSKAVFDAYQTWAEANGVKRPLNRKNLTQRLERLGARPGKAHGGQRVLYGLRLRDGGVSGAFSHPLAYGENTCIQNTGEEIHLYSKNSKGTEVPPLAPPSPQEDDETVLEVLE